MKRFTYSPQPIYYSTITVPVNRVLLRIVVHEATFGEYILGIEVQAVFDYQQSLKEASVDFFDILEEAQKKLLR